MLATGQAAFNIKGIRECLLITPGHWFIKAYIGLYILSPILNLFVEKSSKRQFGITLASFYIFQTVYGFTGAAQFIEYGYSTFSFIGIYLLAQYIKHYVIVDYKGGGGIIYVYRAHKLWCVSNKLQSSIISNDVYQSVCSAWRSRPVFIFQRTSYKVFTVHKFCS